MKADGKATNSRDPTTLAGTAPRLKTRAGRHRMSRQPKPARERFPRSCARVSIGTADLAPTVYARTGRSNNAPPKPAAPETVAASHPAPSRINQRTVINPLSPGQADHGTDHSSRAASTVSPAEGDRHERRLGLPVKSDFSVNKIVADDMLP